MMALYWAVGILVALLCGWLLLGLLPYFIEPKRGTVYRVLLVLLLGIAVSVISSFTEYENMFISVALLLLGICLLCNGSLLARFSVAVMLFSVIASWNVLLIELLIAETASYIVVTVLSVGIAALTKGIWYRRVLPALAVTVGFLAIRSIYPEPMAMQDFMLFKAPFCLLLRQFIRATLAGSKGEELPTRLWVLADLLAIPPCAAFVFIAIWAHHQFGFWDTIVITTPEWMILGIAVVSSLVMLVAVVVLMRLHSAVRERELLRAREAYYENLEESQRQVRTLRHDMANHLQALANLRGAQAEQYLNQLIGSSAISNGIRFCDNETANTILSVKVAEMQESRIPYQMDAALPSSLTIAKVDLCALFGNLLDNAIEASRKLPEEERGISLTARANKGLFILKVENNYSGEIHREGGVLQTVKKDKANHGLGLAGVRDIARRYGGELIVKHEDRRFISVVRCAATLQYHTQQYLDTNRNGRVAKDRKM
jgi:signal transduction histidine kinase